MTTVCATGREAASTWASGEKKRVTEWEEKSVTEWEEKSVAEWKEKSVAEWKEKSVAERDTESRCVERNVSLSCTPDPSISSSNTGCGTNGCRTTQCEVTACEKRGDSNSDQVVGASKETAKKVKKKKKKGKKKEGIIVSTCPVEENKPDAGLGDLTQNFRCLKIVENENENEKLVERGPIRNKDSHEVRQAKPYDVDISPFQNSILPDEIVTGKPTASVPPQTRHGDPSVTQHQLQQFPQQQPQLHEQFLQQQFMQQQVAQWQQQMAQWQQPHHQKDPLLYPPSVPGSALPSIPLNTTNPPALAAPYASSQMQGALLHNNVVTNMNPAFLLSPTGVPVQVNGQYYIQVLANGQCVLVSGPQVSAPHVQGSLPSSTHVAQGQLATLENSQATNANPAREGIPTVVPDVFVPDDPPRKRRVRKANLKDKVNGKKKTSKTSKAKKYSAKSPDDGNAASTSHADSQDSGVSASCSDNIGPQSASLESGGHQLDIPYTDSFGPSIIGSSSQTTSRPLSVGPEDVGPGSCGPQSVGPGSVGSSRAGPQSVGSSRAGPQSVGPASVGSCSVEPGSARPESVGSYLDDSVSFGSCLSVSGGSVTPQSVRTSIDTNDEDSLDLSDIIEMEKSNKGKELKPHHALPLPPTYYHNTTRYTAEDRDASFRFAEEYVESDLKEMTVSRQAGQCSGNSLQSQRGNACMNRDNQPTAPGDEELSLGNLDQQDTLVDLDSTDLIDSLGDFFDQISDNRGPTSEPRALVTNNESPSDAAFTTTNVEAPSAAASNLSNGSRHATSNMAAQGRTVDVNVSVEESPSVSWMQDTIGQARELHLNARVQIGMNRMAPQTSFNEIMESYKRIVPKRTN